MSSKLMSHLWKTMIDTIGKYMDENYPDVKLVVATHSTANYTDWNIISAVNAFTSSEYVDGIIGQTWSDTIRSTIRYGGSFVARLFESAFTEYATYSDSMREGQMLFTLTDAKSDNPNLTWEEYRHLWETTVIAELMQQDIHGFQECVWPSRGFTVAPPDYRTVQLSVFNALGEVGGHASTLYAGTPGISYALGDSISWQWGNQHDKSSASLYGFTVPLIEKGIPVSITSLDYLNSVEDLAGVKVLALAYDSNKPQSEKVNEVIAQWVKEGGTLLYLGGTNGYDSIQTEWWTKKGQTLYQNLMEHLGVEVQAQKMDDSFMSFYQWNGPAGYGEHFNGDKFLDANSMSYTLAYTGTGDGIHSLLSNDSGMFGFETAVGKGHLISVGLPSSYYGASVDGPEQLRDLVRYATTFTDVSYVETDLMVAQRGNFLAAQALDYTEGETMTGNFIDLFEADLPVITTKEIQAGHSAFLYDISELLASDMPRLAYTGGVLKGDVTETADQTVLRIGGPSKTTSSTRLLGNGKYPQSITATVNGNRVGNIVTRWDNASNSLLVRVLHDAAQTVEITVNWGDTAVADTPDYEWKSTSYITGSRNGDAEYLLRTDAKTISSYRQSTYASETVYSFDLDRLGDIYLGLEVFGNYLIEVSSDDRNYTAVYDYRKVSDVYNDDMKTTTLSVFPDMVGAKSGKLYVRIANTDPTKEHGGAIKKLTVNQKQLITSQE